MRGVIVFLVMVLVFAPMSRAVIVYGKQGRNISAPSGKLANSGWQYEGEQGPFSGTPIAPLYYITAGHIGGGDGQTFTINGEAFPTTATFDDPATDLRIYKVDHPFSSFAQLYTGHGEKTKRAVLIGRGTQRGEEIRLGKRNVLHGWRWGEIDNVRSWGTNNVSGVVAGGAGVGDVLKFTFNAGVGPNEATFSANDSGGGVFIKDKGVWKLAAVNYSVDAPYSLDGAAGSGFDAALFDQGGFYTGGDAAWTLIKDRPNNLPQSAYATRISSEMSWIQGVLSGAAAPDAEMIASTGGVPEPALLPLLVIIALVQRRRSRS